MLKLLASMARDIREAKEGRIRRLPGHWKLAPDESRGDGVYAIPGKEGAVAFLDRAVRVSTDKAGRKMHLVHKRCVHCPNPEYADRFASLREERVCLSVPESFCRKCHHYRSARESGRKYATCGYAAVEHPGEETANEVAGLLQKATDKANEIMGNGGINHAD